MSVYHEFNAQQPIATLRLPRHAGHDQLAVARYVRRDDHGRFKEEVDVGKSLAADRPQHAQHKAKKGEGDRGDH